MAIDLANRYPSQHDGSDPVGYPHGQPQNVTTTGDGSGTPWAQPTASDLFGMIQALLADQGLTPNDIPEKVGNSQVLQALNLKLGARNLRADIDLFGFQPASWAWRAALENTVGIALARDGSHVAVEEGNGILYIHSFTRPFDASSIQPATSINMNVAGLNSVSSPASGSSFNPQGTKFYTTKDTVDRLYEYDLSTPWDASTMTYTGGNELVTADDPKGHYWNEDGTLLFVGNTGANPGIRRYSCPTPFSVVGASFDVGQYYDTTGKSLMSGNSFGFDKEGLILACHDGTSNIGFATFGTPWDLTSLPSLNDSEDIDTGRDTRFGSTMCFGQDLLWGMEGASNPNEAIQLYMMHRMVAVA